MQSRYPVIFTENKDIVLIEVPDFHIFSEGTNLQDAIEMTKDAIGLVGTTMINDEIPLPTFTKLNDVTLENSEFFNKGKTSVSFVDIDFVEYEKSLISGL